MPYKFERDELLELLIRAYNEGNNGFLDLAESFAEKLVDECEEEKPEPIISVPLTLPPYQSTVAPYGTDFFDPLESFRRTEVCNNSPNPVSISSIQITTDNTDNLLATYSNQIAAGTRWEPYADTNSIRKEPINGC